MGWGSFVSSVTKPVQQAVSSVVETAKKPEILAAVAPATALVSSEGRKEVLSTYGPIVAPALGLVNPALGAGASMALAAYNAQGAETGGSQMLGAVSPSKTTKPYVPTTLEGAKFTDIETAKGKVIPQDQVPTTPPAPSSAIAPAMPFTSKIDTKMLLIGGAILAVAVFGGVLLAKKGK